MATNPPSDRLRVVVDANLLIAGTGWPRFAYEVLQHAAKADYQMVLSPFIIDEARRHIARLIPARMGDFETFLVASNYEPIATPSSDELARYANLVRDVNDIPVALAAMNAKVDYLVSSDKDLTDPNAPVHQYLAVVLPGTFLREQMRWTSEQLEAIRNRNWNDLP